MRRLLALWTKEWIALSRDLHGLAVLFLMPAAFIAIMSLALSDTFGDRVRVDFAVLGPDAAKIAGELEGDGFRAAPAPANAAAARDLVRQGKLSLVLLAGPRPVVLADPALPQPQVLAFRMRALAVRLLLAAFSFCALELGCPLWPPARKTKSRGQKWPRRPCRATSHALTY